MNTDQHGLIHQEITGKIIGVFFDGYNELGVRGVPRCSKMYASAMLPSAGGAAESLAHHEVVGKREKESEPWRGGSVLFRFGFLKCSCSNLRWLHYILWQFIRPYFREYFSCKPDLPQAKKCSARNTFSYWLLSVKIRG